MTKVAALMLVKDEADIIEHTVRHLCGQVDVVFVSDNLSTDGTTDILQDLASELPVVYFADGEPGYYQDRKTTELAGLAYGGGWEWVVPCDADEIWFSPFGRLADVLSRFQEPFVAGVILNHVVTQDDDLGDPDPVTRIRYRLEEVGRLPKVACRTSPELRIGMGNHEAWTVANVHSRGPLTVEGQVYIHHYPWRSEEQFLRKITNGALAYAAAPDISPDYGTHWRQFGLPGDEGFEHRVREWFQLWGSRAYEEECYTEELVYDPAPEILSRA